MGFVYWSEILRNSHKTQKDFEAFTWEKLGLLGLKWTQKVQSNRGVCIHKISIGKSKTVKPNGLQTRASCHAKERTASDKN